MGVSAKVLCAVLLVPILLVVHRRANPLHSIPTIGPSAPLLSYVGAYRYARSARAMLQEGYNKYKVFKVALWDQWLVVVSGAEMNEELRKLPDEVMSFTDATHELMQVQYTIGQELIDHPIDVIAIRGHLTRNLANLYPDIVDEVNVSLRDLISIQGNEWTNVPGFKTMMQTVARAGNRVFVGLPFCRDTEFLEIPMNFTVDVMKGKTIISTFPKPLQPIVGRLLPWSRNAKQRIASYLQPVVEERIRKLKAHDGEWTDKPNDLLMAHIEEAMKVGQSIDLIVQAFLGTNFGALHTSSISLAHALFHLAASPEYAQPLRDEIEGIVKQDGWTKLAFGKMWKLDSFMKESQRVNGVGAMAILRKAAVDVTLSDGTHVPAGTFVVASASATHRDKDCYDDPDSFRPFRFSDMRAAAGEQVKHQFVTTSPEYIPFGHGKHACPGRFFATNVLKVALACILVNYDVKFEDEGNRPENMWYGTAILPSRTAQVLFRKRQDHRVQGESE